MTPSMESLFRAYPETADEKNVRDWLKTNNTHFIEDNYTPDEVAYLAIQMAGLDRIAVCSVLSHWKDALTGGRIELRYAMKEVQEDITREAMAQSDLFPQWEGLADYSNGIDFKEAA